jgi:hypothetical protein
MKLTRLQLLHEVPRMYWQHEKHPCNFLKGLDELIDEHLNSETVMAEIGSYAAVSSHLFAETVKELYCVDQWLPYPEVAEEHIIEGERLFDNFNKKYDNVHKIKMSSEEASKIIDNSSLDFVYVDAFHSYDAVVADINNWLPNIKAGGYIGGHDYHHDAVREAVHDTLNSNIDSIRTYQDTSWIVKLANG